MAHKKVALNELRAMIRRILSERLGGNVKFKQEFEGSYDENRESLTFGFTYTLSNIEFTEDPEGGELYGTVELFSKDDIQVYVDDFSSPEARSAYSKNRKEINSEILSEFNKYYRENMGKASNEYGSEYDYAEYTIPEWAMAALVNGDTSGLDDEDQNRLDAFVDRVQREHGNANFLLNDPDDKDNLGFRPTNDIDRAGANCFRLYIKPD